MSKVDPTVALVARRVRELRLAAGLTQEEVAARAKLTPKFISSVETAKVNPSIAILGRLAADGLDVPITALFVEAADGAGPRSDLTAATAIIAGLAPGARRRALRVLRALVDE